MKELVKRYLDRDITRRGFLSGLTALGIASATANAMARSLAPFAAQSGEAGAAGLPSWMRPMHGSGGALLVAQLKAAGIQYIFFNPSTGEAPIYNALVDEPNIHLIKALQEGALAAMADGYAKASGKFAFVMCARPGLPNCMTQMFNSWKDRIPVLVAVDNAALDSLGQDAFEEAEHVGEMTRPITKWYWSAETTEKIPEITRRAIKFATTDPCGPVFVAYPEDVLHEEAEATIMDQEKFSVPMKIRPDPKLVEQAARLLLEAQNPLLYVGDEVSWCGATSEVLELAELLGLPVTRPPGSMAWSRPFPTKHPLFLGDYLREMRYPGKVDVMLNLGSRMPYAGARLRILPGVKLIEARLDPGNLARVHPTEVALVGDLKHTAADLLAALRSMATAGRLKQIGDARRAKTAEFTGQRREFLQSIVRSRWDRNPISAERLGMELEQFLDKDACFVSEIDSGRTMESLIALGGDDRRYFSNSGRALGWGLPAALGIKLALPDQPVVAVMGDGAFLFSGPQPLWSFARYRAPVTIIVLNNRSYNNERNRIWTQGGRQFEVGRDMACYMGDPDMDFVKIASGFGVEGTVVEEPSAIRPALERAQRATVSGAPYLLDVRVERGGIGAASTWHPGFTVESLRKRKV
jgi:benzoylformate decarboxylase